VGCEGRPGHEEGPLRVQASPQRRQEHARCRGLSRY
jgi:hypothetical protein